MNEIAAITESAVRVLAKCSTLLGFILRVEVVIFLELVGAMCELAVPLVGAKAVLGEFPAEFGLFFVRKEIFRGVLGRKRLLGRE